MPLTYRNATPADLPFIIALIVEDSVIQTGDDPADAMHPDYVDALAEITADPNEEMIIVDEDGVPVGCFQLSYLPGLMRRGMKRGQIEVGLESLINQYGVQAVIESLNQMAKVQKSPGDK